MRLIGIAMASAALLFVGCSSIPGGGSEEPLFDNSGDRTIGTKIDDKSLEWQISRNIDAASPDLKASNINIKIYNGQVLMAGQVPNIESKTIAEKVALQHKRVTRVINQLEVAGKATVLDYVNDLTISTRVKVHLAQKLDYELMKRILVTTEDSQIYVMGFVTKPEAQYVTEAISSLGVGARVITVYEYID